MPSDGSISVVVVSHDHRRELARSLPALLRELRGTDELIVVDNASADGTADAVAGIAPVATVLRNASNLGFAAAANRGAVAARSDLIVFLNPDAVPAPGFGEAIRAPLADDRFAAWMGLVTMEEGARVNTDGGVVHFTGISWSGNAGAAVESVPGEPREVAFLSGACLAVPRERWRELGGFPPEFFLYCEDVDLSLRLRLAGGRLGMVPAARVDHEYDFHKGPAKWRLLERNRWATILRTYPAPLLALLAPALLATELALLPLSLAGGWGRQKLLAHADVLRRLPRLLRERRAIQAGRSVSAAEFAAWLTPDLDSPYLGRAGRSRALRTALRAYWAVVTALLGAPRRSATTSRPA